MKADLLKIGARVEVDVRAEKLGLKIREAQLKKIPYMLVVGDKEVEANCVAVRSRKDGDKGSLPVADFVANLQTEVAQKI